MNQLAEIKQLRKKYNLTQKDLANQSGVSQSLIAKIEAGLVEPTYSKTMSLFQALNQHRVKDQAKASDVMTKKVIVVNKMDQIEKVIRIMKLNNISQVPIVDHNLIVGLVTEAVLLEKTIQYLGKINHLIAESVMIEAPPLVPPTTGIVTVLELLRHSAVVLVQEAGKLTGIISKSDLLGELKS